MKLTIAFLLVATASIASASTSIQLGSLRERTDDLEKDSNDGSNASTTTAATTSTMKKLRVRQLQGKQKKAGKPKKRKKGKSSKSTVDYWKMADLHASAKPYAIGHRGFGATKDSGGVLGGIPSENTIDSVLAAFDIGASVVEIDVVLTADGNVFVDHNDYLADFSCINQMTTDDLKQVLPESTTLFKLLKKVRHYARGGNTDQDPSGLVIIEVKTPSPLCDPNDDTEEELMKAVVSDIQKARMTEQVEIDSFSPALLVLANSLAPEIPRGLLMGAIQFLTPEQVEAETGLKVTLIEKEDNLGLQWAEIGGLFRLPGYASLEQFVSTAANTTIVATTVSIDKLVLGQAGESGAGFVAGLQSQGFTVHGWTVQLTSEWIFLQQLGVDGIITDLLAEGIDLQAAN